MGGWGGTMLSDGWSTCTHLPSLSAHTYVGTHGQHMLKGRGWGMGAGLWGGGGGVQVVLRPEFLPHEPSVGIPATHFLVRLQELKLTSPPD